RLAEGLAPRSLSPRTLAQVEGHVEEARVGDLLDVDRRVHDDLPQEAWRERPDQGINVAPLERQADDVQAAVDHRANMAQRLRVERIRIAPPGVELSFAPVGWGDVHRGVRVVSPRGQLEGPRARRRVDPII